MSGSLKDQQRKKKIWARKQKRARRRKSKQMSALLSENELMQTADREVSNRSNQYEKCHLHASIVFHWSFAYSSLENLRVDMWSLVTGLAWEKKSIIGNIYSPVSGLPWARDTGCLQSADSRWYIILFSFGVKAYWRPLWCNGMTWTGKKDKGAFKKENLLFSVR